MKDLLHSCIDRFGTAPRRLSFWDRMRYLRVPRPDWIRHDPSDKLMTLFNNLPSVFIDGTVVWGHIIQANGLLFQAGDQNHPGEVVFSLHDQDRVELDDLQQIAHCLYSLKGTEPDDPELLPIADYLTDERIRVFGLAVPRSISSKYRCRISTTYFVRKHLPRHRLCMPLLPMVVNPREPLVAMPLPKKYWPEELVEWWSQ